MYNLETYLLLDTLLELLLEIVDVENSLIKIIYPSVDILSYIIVVFIVSGGRIVRIFDVLVWLFCFSIPNAGFVMFIVNVFWTVVGFILLLYFFLHGM